MIKQLKFIIESLLFVADEPVSIQQLKALIETEDTVAIRTAIEELTQEYDHRCGGFELRHIAGGYQFRTRSEYSEWVKKFLKPSPAKLSRAALETLAIIAYKQPIIRADVEHIRGVDCGGVLRMLLEKKLVRVLGRKDIPGRPMIYGTTRQFLEVFNLKDLRDLPSPKEIESLGTDEAETYPLAEEDSARPSSPEEASLGHPPEDSAEPPNPRNTVHDRHPEVNQATSGFKPDSPAEIEPTSAPENRPSSSSDSSREKDPSEGTPPTRTEDANEDQESALSAPAFGNDAKENNFDGKKS